MKELDCNAYGIDVDEVTNTYLRETMHLNTINCDIDNGTSFPSDFFDFIIMRHSLEHVYNPVKVLQEVRRILKSDGSLIIGVHNTINTLLRNSGFSIENIHHELRVRRISLERWLAASSLLPFRIPKFLMSITGKILAIFRKGERIVVLARKTSNYSSKNNSIR